MMCFIPYIKAALLGHIILCLIRIQFIPLNEYGDLESLGPVTN